jgi:hypothetical protein
MARKGKEQNNNKQNNNKPKQNSPFFVAKEIRLVGRRLENVIFPVVTK